MHGPSPFISGSIFPKNWVKLSYTPLETDEFCYSARQGIDSYIGAISSDSIEFTFDFGFYSSDEIWSKADIQNTLIRNKGYYLKSCGLSNERDKYLSQNLTIEKINRSDTLFDNKPSLEIMCHDTYCVLSDLRINPAVAETKDYEFEETFEYGLHTKIYYPKLGSDQNKIGLFIGPDNDHIQTVIQKLRISSSEFNPEEKKHILDYLRAARDAFMQENKDKLN